MQRLVEQSKKITDFIKSLFKNKVFYLYLALFLIILASSFNSFFILLSIFIIVYAVIFLNFENSLSMLLFLFPFKLLTARIFDYLFAFAMLVYWVKFIIKSIKIKEFKKIYTVYFITVAIFIIYLVLPIHKSFDAGFLSSFSLNNFLFCFNLFLALFLFAVNLKELKFLKLFRILFIGFVISNIVAVICLVVPSMQTNFVILKRYELIRFPGLFIHPNRLSTMSIILVVCLLYFYLLKKIGHIEFVLSFVLTCAVGYATLSRTFLYCFIISFVIFVIVTIVKDKKQFYKKTLIVFSLFLASTLIMFNYSKILFNDLGISEIFFGYGNSVDNSYEDLLNGGDPGRGGLYKVFFLDLISSPIVFLFGRGMSHEPIIKSGLTSHNTYLQIAWKIGIVGVLLFIVIMLASIKLYTNISYKKFIKTAFSDIYLYLLLIPILAGIFVENIFPAVELVVYLVIIISAVYEKESSVGQDNLINNKQTIDVEIANENKWKYVKFKKLVYKYIS